ncbi:hypothetical protein [Shewanella salipaludis]|uniref:Uncharacterized protein n=1 Tax=Shewanella salipaludis TaxID=2723052 RepID=A0A972JK28_9GAMM|nr:hypothetical protein [Shewanella salipaludis]NMH63907.1 hypothetical protein [Shewanella salipaludis]
MTDRAVYVGILIVAAVLVSMLYIAFGQLTVKRLRKNPKTKDALGLEYVSGWDIINVAQALALPRNWSKKLEERSRYFMHAKASLLLENTNKFDRLLGSVFYWLLIITGLSSALLVLLNSIGIFRQ